MKFSEVHGDKDAGMRELLERAVGASSNGIVITDARLPDNPIIYVNPAFERITGYPAGEVLGQNCRFLQGANRDQPELQELRTAILEGRECHVLLRNYRKDGAPFSNELYVSPVYGEDGRLANFIGVQNDVTSRQLAEEEREKLLVGEQLAQARAAKVQRRLALFSAADPLLSSSLDYEATLKRISRLTVPELADWCMVDVVEEGGSVNQLVGAHAKPEKESLLRDLGDHRRFDEIRPGSVAEVLSTGRPVLVPEVSDSFLDEISITPEHRKLLRRLGLCSLISVPLLARGRTLGAITLVSSDPERRYGPEDLSLAESLAYRCALALDNARLYREHSYIARTLQQGLLLRDLPEIPGVEVGVQYLSVGEDSEVGGDFYDLIDTRDDGWLCVIGDVCGKGARAATLTALALHTLRAVSLYQSRPSEILSALNEAIIRQNPANQFCTAVCVQLEPEAGNRGGAALTVARGGHPPPLLLNEDNIVGAVGEPGKALGVFSELDLSNYTVRLGPGEVLVLYTDGIIESRAPDGSFFGEERLRSLLRSCAGLDAASIACRMKDAVLEHQGGNLTDDLALLVLRVPNRVSGP